MQFSLLILSLACLATALCAFLLLWQGRRQRDVQDRLQHLIMPATQAGRPRLSLRHWPDLRGLLPQSARTRLYQAGLEFSEDRFFAILIFLLSLTLASAFVFGIFVAALFLMSVVLVAVAIVDYRARKRMDALSDAMLGYFDRVRQLLVVGNSLSVALARATQSSPPVVVEFFQPTMRRIANGASVGESVNQLAREVDIYELRLFGAAIETNLRFGGALTAILANLIETRRRRAALMREVRVNTSQIRASAWVLGILPILVSAVVMSQSPDYMRWFIDEPAGRSLLVYCAVSQLIGAFLMRKVVGSTGY